MVAHQTLTLFVRVRILHPLPMKLLEQLLLWEFLYYQELRMVYGQSFF